MEVKNINKETTVSIGLFITLAGSLIFLGMIFQRLIVVERRVDVVEAKIDTLPNQNQYDSLEKLIDTRFTNLEKSIEELKKK